MRPEWSAKFTWIHNWLPVPLVRNHLCHFYPRARQLLGENCSLWIFPQPTTVAYLTPVRSLVAIHDLMHRYETRFPEVGEAREYRIRERLFSNVCRYSDGILVDSECGREHVLESYGAIAHRPRILVQPFLPPAYIYSDDDVPQVLKKHGLPEKFLIYPAQFWPHKNHAALLRAFARARQQLPDAVLALCGEMRLDYGKLAALADSLGLGDAVRFLGYVDDHEVAALYRRARGLIYPSFFGPTNIPPLEAFALGCPVAASGVYGMQAQLGDAALLFDPTSETSITEAICTLWRDEALCAQLRQRGLARSRTWTAPEFAQRLKLNLQSILQAPAAS
jgi:glycosyltransferase involved in cell wall biosynthesis